tara:strand:+ start:2901 stop:3620 length:720 start_codon:yes stop_codon:yes gene_type:complete
MNIVFVVAHPDDETLWVGGLLNYLSKLDNVTPHVICMTGQNNVERYEEFKNSMRIANIKNCVVGDMEIPANGTIPLNDIEGVFNNSLQELKLTTKDIDLLITHSFYGDEHEHLQHRQLFNHFFESGIPFAFFSSMTLPVQMACTLKTMKREHNTHLINEAVVLNFDGATHYLQFKVDEQIKNKMLQQYNSINLEEHMQGYATWDSYIEGLYFKNAEAYEVFKPIVDRMPSPGGPRSFLN